MEKDNKVIAETRRETGSNAARRLRAAGWLPAVLYGGGQEAQALRLNQHDFALLLQHHAGENLMVELEVDGGPSRKVLLRDVQHDPVTGGVLHADLVAVSMTETMRVQIPVVLVGEPVGVKEAEGVLEHLLRELEVECLPGDLVESVEVDVSGLNINESIQVGQLETDAKLTVLSPPDVVVATVVPPRVEEEAAPAEAAEEGAEPEVIGEEEEKAKAEEKEEHQDRRREREG